MNQRAVKESFKPVTDSLPEDVAALARGIGDGGADHFISHVYDHYGASDAAADDNGRSSLYWVEGWKNPQTGLWTLEQHNKINQGADAQSLWSKETLAKNISFFDALHGAAAFEARQKLKIAPLENPVVAEGKQHLRVAADAALIPFDVDEMPHPAAFGRILTDGMFDEAAHALAARTKGREIVPVSETRQARAMTEQLLGGTDPETVSDGALVRRGLSEGKTALIQSGLIKTALSAATHVRWAVDNVSRYDLDDHPGFFRDPMDSRSIMPSVATVFTLGTFYPVYCGYKYLAASYSNETAKGRYRTARFAFMRAVRKLSDGPEKSLLHDFGKAASAAYKLEQACFHRDNCRSNGSQRALDKGLWLIHKAAAEIGTPAHEADKLARLYVSDDFPPRGHFSAKLEQQLKETAAQLGFKPA